MTSAQPLWKPSPEAIAHHPLTAFGRQAEARSRRSLPGFAELHAWSVEDRGGFWDLIWDFCGVVGDKGEWLVDRSSTSVDLTQRDGVAPDGQLLAGAVLHRVRVEGGRPPPPRFSSAWRGSSRCPAARWRPGPM